jgi:hypothetical protein
LQNRTPETSSPAGEDHPNVKAAFLALGNLWPREFRKQFGTSDTSGVWRHALAELSADQVKRGIVQVSRTDERWPPNPGQFRAICIRTRQEDKPKPKKIERDSSPYGLAREACHAAFHHRLTQERVLRELPAHIRYEGDLDVLYVVNSVEVDWNEQDRLMTSAKRVNLMKRFYEPLYEAMREIMVREWDAMEPQF